MGTTRHIPRGLSYEQALKHPVFVQGDGGGRHGRSEGPIALATSVVLPACDRVRRQIAQKILRFFEVANLHWRGHAETHAPELNILIDLYVQEQDGNPVAVTDACVAARVPCTSALRSIDRLIAEGLIARTLDQRDSRRKLLSLTGEGQRTVAEFIDRFGTGWE